MEEIDMHVSLRRRPDSDAGATIWRIAARFLRQLGETLSKTAPFSLARNLQ
jgi:hypothetical protein